MFSKGSWRDLIVSLSIANLWFIKLWLKILPYSAGGNIYLPYSPRNTYLAAMLNVLLLGALLFCLLRLCRKRETLFPWLVLAVFLATCLFVAYGAGVAFISVARFVFLFGVRGALWLELACGVAGAALLTLLVWKRRWLAGRYAMFPLLFAPYLLVTFGESAAALTKLEPAAQFLPHAIKPSRPLVNPLPSRVVWIIFDETDYRLCFDKRPRSLALPAFDRLRSGALFATAAYSPNDNTHTSLPALLTGIPLDRTEERGARRLELVHAGGRGRSDFASDDTIFKGVKRRGGSTALFGWYLPYSRTLSGVDLGRNYARYNFYTSDSLFRVLLCQWRELVDLRFLPFENTLLAQNQIDMVRQMRSDVAAAVHDDDATMMFLHYSVPHSPNVFHRRTGRYGFNRDKREAYFDNVALADRCLAELRKEMEAKGTWDSSLVIVSSDHHWRTNTYDQQLDKQHVPFLAKFPHQKKGMTYNGKFNTVLTKDLILNFLDKKVSSPEDACHWLDLAMQSGKSPVIISAVQPDAD